MLRTRPRDGMETDAAVIYFSNCALSPVTLLPDVLADHKIVATCFQNSVDRAVAFQQANIARILPKNAEESQLIQAKVAHAALANFVTKPSKAMVRTLGPRLATNIRPVFSNFGSSHTRGGPSPHCLHAQCFVEKGQASRSDSEVERIPKTTPALLGVWPRAAKDSCADFLDGYEKPKDFWTKGPKTWMKPTFYGLRSTDVPCLTMPGAFSATSAILKIS